MAEIFLNRGPNIKHVELLIAGHRMQFLGVAAHLEHTIAGVQHRNVWPGLYSKIGREITNMLENTSQHIACDFDTSQGP